MPEILARIPHEIAAATPHLFAAARPHSVGLLHSPTAPGPSVAKPGLPETPKLVPASSLPGAYKGSMRIFAPLVLLAGALGAQNNAAPIADRIKHEGLHNSQVMAYLDYLTNSIGHRLTGSDNYMLACKWALAEFKKMGLDARLEQWQTWRFAFNRGQWSGRIESPEKIELQVATEAWTAGTRGNVRGRAVVVPGSILDVEEQLAGKVKGAWLWIRKPTRRSRAGRELWNYVKGFAIDEGAAGLVYASAGDAKYPNRIRVFGSRNMALSANSRIPTLPEVCVRKDQWQRVEKMIKAGKEVTAAFDIRNRFRRETVPLYNVIADIKGFEKPDEFVIVCGHLDSWHQATGTTDNGTGTTSTMEAARILAASGARPRRTIRFCLWGGEEQGLLGSRRYVLKYRTKMKNVSAVFNHDTGTNWAHTIAVPENMYDDFKRILEPVMSIKAPDKDFEGPVFRLRKVRQMSRRGGGSDHASFLSAGVPAWSWGLRGRSNYFQHTWHSQWDTFDVAIPEYQRHTSTVVALTAYGVAMLPHLLPRDQMAPPGSGARRRPAVRASDADNSKKAESKKADSKKGESKGETKKVEASNAVKIGR